MLAVRRRKKHSMKKLLLALTMLLMPIATSEDGHIIGKALQSLDAGTGIIKPDPPRGESIIWTVIQIGPGVFVVIVGN